MPQQQNVIFRSSLFIFILLLLRDLRWCLTVWKRYGRVDDLLYVQDQIRSRRLQVALLLIRGVSLAVAWRTCPVLRSSCRILDASFPSQMCRTTHLQLCATHSPLLVWQHFVDHLELLIAHRTSRNDHALGTMQSAHSLTTIAADVHASVRHVLIANVEVERQVSACLYERRAVRLHVDDICCWTR